jgi:DNA-directed RNA polymerase specialized sigma24 family protein
MSRKTDFEGPDLLQDAFVRWLTSEKPIEGPEQTCAFLYGAIKSLRSNWNRHDRVVRQTHGVRVTADKDSDDDPIAHASDPSTDPDDHLVPQQLYDHCEGDDDVQIMLLKQFDNATAEEIRTECGWDQTQYETVRRRKRRLTIRWMREGKLG